MPSRYGIDIESQKSASAGSSYPIVRGTETDKLVDSLGWNKETSAPIINHPRFFLDDRLVVIQAENVRFNVHKYHLMKSKTFNNLLATEEQAKLRGKPIEGSIDNPIQLEGISASDFECLLTVLYADYFSDRHPQTNASLIVPAFRLANILNFSDLRIHLLPLAKKVLSDVDKIVLAREFDIKDWLVPAYTNLCQRSSPLTTDEATKLGIDNLLMISILRQEFPQQPRSTSASTCSGIYCPNCTGYHSSTHCTGCNIQTTRPAFGFPKKRAKTAKNPNAMQERLNEWVRNGCEFKVD